MNMLKAHNIKKIKYVLLLLVGLTYYLLGGDLGLSDSSVPSGSAAGSEVYAAFQDKRVTYRCVAMERFPGCFRMT